MTVIAAIIPARFAATRLPGKPLLEIAGKPMIQHVCERVARAARLDRVLVATDDSRIVAAVQAFGGEVVLTSPHHQSGTDRVAEAARTLQADLVVNVQGDEPLLDPAAIDLATASLLADPTLPMGTIAHPIEHPADLLDPNVVKVVRDRRGCALYFSRWPIPYQRDPFGAPLPGAVPAPESWAAWPARPLRHVGLYVYRADFLQTFARLVPTPLELSERLEQLRALEHGHPIRVVETGPMGPGVDTPADLARIRELLTSMDGESRCPASPVGHGRDGRPGRQAP
ncbi:MAG: 3-deoxy-manno-octulosonate cytidylyltransferase [Magnetococcales bacterium]|nr:3-deoxy-manno-octulosonate cytidylyltransferase [Magnetococcales bacterium]